MTTNVLSVGALYNSHLSTGSGADQRLLVCDPTRIFSAGLHERDVAVGEDRDLFGALYGSCIVYREVAVSGKWQLVIYFNNSRQQHNNKGWRSKYSTQNMQGSMFT